MMFHILNVVLKNFIYVKFVILCIVYSIVYKCVSVKKENSIIFMLILGEKNVFICCCASHLKYSLKSATLKSTNTLNLYTAAVYSKNN